MCYCTPERRTPQCPYCGEVLSKEIERLTQQRDELQAELAALKAELKAISVAIDDPCTDLTMTMVEVIQELKATTSEPEDLLGSKPDFHDDKCEQLAFELAFELESAELDRNDYVTVNREKLTAIAKRVLGRLAPASEHVEIDWPEYNAEAMGCDLEDRDIIDRYEAMRYGWDEAIERVAERLPEKLFTAPQPAPASEPVGHFCKNLDDDWDQVPSCVAEDLEAVPLYRAPPNTDELVAALELIEAGITWPVTVARTALAKWEGKK